MRVELETGIWRPAALADLAAIDAIADAVHVAYPEESAVIADRLRLYPEGCALFERDGKPLAYALTHPWRYAEPPALNVMLGEIPADPTTYYIHDVALLPETRGTGAGSAIVKAIIAQAKAAGADNLSLVAVNRSIPFWSRFGFEVTRIAALDAKLKSYDDDARFMVLPIER